MNADCIFCKIVAGQLPCTKIYEDETCLAFLDIGPVAKGHTLVIPKEHCDPITGTPVDTLQKVIAVVQKVANAQFKGLKADGINVTQANGQCAGQIIPHIHFHVIPRYDDGQERNWIPRKYSDAAEMARFGEKIRKAIGQ